MINFWTSLDEISPLDRLVTLQVAKEICPIRTALSAPIVIPWPALPSIPVPSELPSPVPTISTLPPPLPSSPPISSTPTPSTPPTPPTLPTPPTPLQQTITSLPEPTPSVENITTTQTVSPIPSPPPSPQQTTASLPEPTPTVENPLPEGNPFMNPTQYPDEEIVASIMGLAPTAPSQGPSVQGK